MTDPERRSVTDRVREYLAWAEADVPNGRTFEDWHEKADVLLRDLVAEQWSVEALAAALNETVGKHGWLRSTPPDPVQEWRENAAAILSALPHDATEPAGPLDADPFAWWKESRYSVSDLQRAYAQGQAEVGAPRDDASPYRDLNEHIRQSNAGTHLFDPACYFCRADEALGAPREDERLRPGWRTPPETFTAGHPDNENATVDTISPKEPSR